MRSSNFTLHNLLYIIILFTTLTFSSTVFAEETVLFDTNSSAKVYFIKQSLVQENETVRTVWIKYEYTKLGSSDLKRNANLVRFPKSSKVKYGFDCTSNKHQVMYASIYDAGGTSILTITNASIEEVIPGSVGEAIRNLVCNYDMENNKVGEQI